MTHTHEARFWKKLGAMLSAGVPLLPTLETLAEADDLGEDVAHAAAGLVAGLKRGLTLSESLAQAPGPFGPDVIHMVRGAEAQGTLDDIAGAIGRQFEEGLLAPADRASDAQATLAPGDAPDVALADVLEVALAAAASDIHFDATAGGGRIRLRIDGVLSTRWTFDETNFRSIMAQLKLMARMDVAEKRLPQHGRILASTLREAHGTVEEIDLRVAVGPTVVGEAATLRVLRKRDIDRAFGSLERIFPERDIRETILEAAKKPYGLFLATGPTGSGKTTTAYALLGQQDADRNKLMSVEDPVEAQLEGVHQVPVQPTLGLFFPAALRHIMQMDPDVVYCSEIRDMETATMLLRIAVTGHLVFSQLHTRDAVEALMRLLHLGLEPYLLSDALSGITSQRLVRKLCHTCRSPQPEAHDSLAQILGTSLPEGVELMGPVGCPACSHTGFRGRRPLYEVLVPTNELRQLLHTDPSVDEVREVVRAGGMKSMFENALVPLYNGETSLAELLRVCPH